MKHIHFYSVLLYTMVFTLVFKNTVPWYLYGMCNLELNDYYIIYHAVYMALLNILLPCRTHPIVIL